MELGVLVRERPRIPSPEFEYEEINIPGRDGSLFRETKKVKDIVINVPFTFVDYENWQERLRNVRKWLLQKKDHKLILSDNEEYFYLVKHVKINATERKVKESGEFDVDFTCAGFQYRRDGALEHSVAEVEYNPYYECMPIYKIIGVGECTLAVNDKNMIANVNGHLIIDTNRMLTYRQDGKLENASVKGDYEDLYLEEGENMIRITPGFELKVIPNWRCL